MIDLAEAQNAVHYARGRLDVDPSQVNIVLFQVAVERLTRARLQKDRSDAERRLRNLRHACGFIEAGEGQSVNIGQDDATGGWDAAVGPVRHYYAASFNELLDKLGEEVEEHT